MVQSEVPATACQDPAGRHCRLSVQHRHLCPASDAERPPSRCQSAPRHRRRRRQVDSIVHNILAAGHRSMLEGQQASCSRPTFLPGLPPAPHPQPQLHSVTPPEDEPGSPPARSLQDSQQQSDLSLHSGQPTAYTDKNPAVVCSCPWSMRDHQHVQQGHTGYSLHRW